MNDMHCPYMDGSCPKVNELEERIDIMETRQVSIVRILYYIAGVVSVTMSVGIGSVIM